MDRAFEKHYIFLSLVCAAIAFANSFKLLYGVHSTVLISVPPLRCTKTVYIREGGMPRALSTRRTLQVSYTCYFTRQRICFYPISLSRTPGNLEAVPPGAHTAARSFMNVPARLPVGHR